METKDSKEKKLKELSDKDLEKVSGGIGPGLDAEICPTGLVEVCKLQGGRFNLDTCRCEH